MNGKDLSGFRVVFEDEETQRQYDQWIRTQRPVSVATSANNSSSFSYTDSAAKGTKSGAIDKIGEVAGGTLIKEKKVWQSFETLTLGKYVSNLGREAKFGKKALGLAGTVGFALWDVGKDLKQGELYSAAIDVASTIVGFGAGVIIGLGAAALVTASTPVLLAGAIGVGAFAATVGTGVAIDKYATYRKDTYYGR